MSYSSRKGVHPLENVGQFNPRLAFAVLGCANSATADSSRWREAWASAHHDGSITLAAAVGGHGKSSDGYFEGWEVEAGAIEAAVADFAALIRATAAALHHGEYDICVGVVWTGAEDLMILTVDGMGFTYDGVSTPLSYYSPVRSRSTRHRQTQRSISRCTSSPRTASIRVGSLLHVIRNHQTEPEETLDRGSLAGRTPDHTPRTRDYTYSSERNRLCCSRSCKRGGTSVTGVAPKDVPGLGNRSHRPSQLSRCFGSRLRRRRHRESCTDLRAVQ